VPETLAPLLEKRGRYKALIRQLPPGDPQRERYERRYSAHKWLLVTCFGYLGYKNARFGRIEAHEAVNAYGREVLLTAKELVEAEGFRVLHLYVDGLWIHKPGVQPSEALAAELQEHVKKELAPYKYPRRVEFVTELPRTETGKVRRVELRQQEAARARTA